MSWAELGKRKISKKNILEKLSENKRILVERDEERKRMMIQKEAKIELWKSWRQKKGRGSKPKIQEIKEIKKRSLEQK